MSKVYGTDILLPVKSANVIFSGPSTGAAATPTWRALVLADLPSFPLSSLAAGTLGVTLQLGSQYITATTNVLILGGNNAAGALLVDDRIQVGALTTLTNDPGAGGISLTGQAVFLGTGGVTATKFGIAVNSTNLQLNAPTSDGIIMTVNNATTLLTATASAITLGVTLALGTNSITSTASSSWNVPTGSTLAFQVNSAASLTVASTGITTNQINATTLALSGASINYPSGGSLGITSGSGPVVQIATFGGSQSLVLSGGMALGSGGVLTTAGGNVTLTGGVGVAGAILVNDRMQIKASTSLANNPGAGGLYVDQALVLGNTGGAGFYLKQTTAGGTVTSGTIPLSDLVAGTLGVTLALGTQVITSTGPTSWTNSSGVIQHKVATGYYHEFEVAGADMLLLGYSQFYGGQGNLRWEVGSYNGGGAVLSSDGVSVNTLFYTGGSYQVANQAYGSFFYLNANDTASPSYLDWQIGYGTGGRTAIRSTGNGNSIQYATGTAGGSGASHTFSDGANVSQLIINESGLSFPSGSASQITANTDMILGTVAANLLGLGTCPALGGPAAYAWSIGVYATYTSSPDVGYSGICSSVGRDVIINSQTTTSLDINGTAIVQVNSSGLVLPASGGTNFVVKQSSAGGTLTAAALLAAEIPDLSATYSVLAGNTSLVTVGTIATGTWAGTTIAPTHGGTGLSAYTLGGLIYGSAANTLAQLSGNTTTAKQFLSQTGTGSVSAAPAWTSITLANLAAGTLGVGLALGTQLVTSTAATSWLTSAGSIGLGVGSTVELLVDANGVALGVSAPALTATAGFPYIPATAGTPTGVPTARTGYVAMRYDTTAHKIWIYDGAWKGVVVA